MRRLFSPTTGLIEDNIAPINRGGTDATIASQALINFDAIPSSAVGQPNGPVPLDSSAKVVTAFLPPSVDPVVITGSAAIYAMENSNYTIVDYSNFDTYEISALGGSISRIGNNLSYTAPATPGNSGFVVNGRQFDITILPVGVNPPSVTYPVNNAVNRPWKQDFTGSAFTVTGVSDTHASSDWELATDSGFNTIIASSLSDTVNKTTWSVTDLDPGITYYVRVRYNGLAYGTSDWSTTSNFTTRSTFLPTTQDNVIYPADVTASAGVGANGGLAMSYDGTRLVLGASGYIYVFLRSGTGWTQEAKFTASESIAGTGFGYGVDCTTDCERIVVGAYLSDVGATDTGAAYVFVRSGNTWVQEAKLVASDRAAGDMFSYYSPCISGDGTWIAIPSPWSDVGGLTDCGAVYMYSRSGSTWTQSQKLLASDRAAGDRFGFSIDVTTDGTRLSVGANSATVGGISSCGTVYIFTRSGSTWSQEAKLTASDKTAGDQFGLITRLTANGDRVAITSPLADVGGVTDAGAIYVFTRSGTTWTQEAKLTASDKTATDEFGTRLRITEDGSRVMAGAYLAEVGGLNESGAAYVFVRSGTIWTQETKLSASDRSAVGRFGSEIAISGDGQLFAIGSPGRDSLGLTDSGGVYFYTPSGYVMAEEAILTAGDKAANDGFGIAVAISGDGTRLAVNADAATVGGVTACGAVYVYTLSGTTWTLEQKLTASDKAANDYFGFGLDMTPDGTRIIAGTSGASEGGVSRCGKAYVFVRSGTTWTQEAKLVASDKAIDDYLGHWGVAIAGSGDRVAVGGYGCDVSGVSACGAVYIFTRSGSTWTQETKLSPADRAANNQFGMFVALTATGDRLIASAHVATVSTITACGAVYIYSRSGTAWTQEAKLSPADRAASDYFGYGVKIASDGSRAFIGSPYGDLAGHADCGKVYSFSRSGTTWTQEAILYATDATTNDHFGTRLVCSSDASSVAIGSLTTVDGFTAAGSIYLFTRSGTAWTQIYQYTASDAATDDSLGVLGLAANATISTIVSGAPYRNSGGLSNSGAAYIYR